MNSKSNDNTTMTKDEFEQLASTLEGLYKSRSPLFVEALDLTMQKFPEGEAKEEMIKIRQSFLDSPDFHKPSAVALH